MKLVPIPPVQTGVRVWSSSSWRESALCWVDARLEAAGMQRTGEVEQPHLRPWATALRVPTRQGVVWLKAAGPGTAFEVPLYQLLQRLTPSRVLTPLGIDVARSWLLLPDGGATLGDRLDGSDLVDALVEILPQYAELQRELAPHAAALLDLGVMDMRAAVMPSRFEEALSASASYVEQHGQDADRTTLERLRALRPRFGAWCARLAAAPGLPSLDHNDLHPHNIFIGPPGGKQAAFYDWGDSVVGHPFASLLVVLRSLVRQLQVEPRDPLVARVRDAYLEVFADLAPRAALLEAVELACQVAKVARALSWERVVSTLDAGEAQDYADAPLRWLAMLLDDAPRRVRL